MLLVDDVAFHADDNGIHTCICYSRSKWERSERTGGGKGGGGICRIFFLLLFLLFLLFLIILLLCGIYLGRHQPLTAYIHTEYIIYIYMRGHTHVLLHITHHVPWWVRTGCFSSWTLSPCRPMGDDDDSTEHRGEGGGASETTETQEEPEKKIKCFEWHFQEENRTTTDWLLRD